MEKKVQQYKKKGQQKNCPDWGEFLDIELAGL
jgi:hypothetical protein